MPQIDNPAVEDASVNHYGVESFQVLVDGQPSPSMTLRDSDLMRVVSGEEVDTSIGYGWDTTMVSNGPHEITLVAAGADGAERRWSTILDVEN